MGELTVAAGATRRTYEVTDRGVRAVQVGRTPVKDEGFGLVVDGRTVRASDLLLAAPPRVAVGGRQASWRLTGDGLAVEVVVKAEREAPVVRTRLEVSGTGRLDEVDVERWGSGVVAPAPALGEHVLGQPLWGTGLFAGLEHPGAENGVIPDRGGDVRMGLPVAVDLAEGPWVSPSAVVGTSTPGQERCAFWDELDRLRPKPPRMVVLANNWYQLGSVGRMDERSVRAELDGFAAVADRHDLPLDFSCLDDPWDGEWTAEHGLWGRMAPSRFPRGLPEARGKVGGIGLWVSPFGGYFDRHDARVAWGAEQGYEIQEGSWPCLCPAGDRYRRDLVDALRGWTAAGVRYWKLDGVQFDCEDGGHGHAVGRGGRTAQMDRFGGLLDAVRSVDPAVVLTFTTGSTPSPWWLRHADFLWRGGLDDDAPAEHEGGRLERFATYIDSCLDALRHTAMPVSAIVTFSVVANEVRSYRDEGADPLAWERHCWFLVGRGTHHHDLYVAPDSLSDQEWEALAAALRWARAHQGVLARSRMIGGRPAAGEPYGFASVGQGRVVLCLRNPVGRTQELSLSALDLAGPGTTACGLAPVWGRATAVSATIGPGETASVELEPFEVVLVSGRVRSSSSDAGGP